MKDFSGIYTITNLVNGKIYVGQTVGIIGRKGSHFTDLKLGKDSPHLQAAYDKYGKENFIYELLEECEEQFLNSQEHYWCLMLNVHNSKHGYNIRRTHPHGGNSRGRHSEYSKLKMKDTPADMIVPGYKDYKFKNYRKKVLQFDLEGNFIKEWETSKEIVDTLGINYCRLRRHVRGTYNHYKQSIFVYEDKYTGNIYDHPYFNVDERVFQYDKEGNFLKVFGGFNPAARHIHRAPIYLKDILINRKLDLLENCYWSYKYLTPEQIKNVEI